MRHSRCGAAQAAADVKVLIVGGGGVFGSRLAELLTRDKHEVTLASRDAKHLEPVARHLACRTMTLNRTAELTPILAAKPDVVIDAAGPFQAYDNDPYRLAHFCVAHRINYLDLSDDARFTAGIVALNGDAMKSNVFALSGASSVPAISAAAVTQLSRGMTAIESIDSAILPGNRASRGRSLVAAILKQVGQPLRLWRDGWVEAPAWSAPRRYDIGDGAMRSARLIGAPDIALFPGKFHARSVTFRAGMELGALNLAVSIYARLHRLGLIKPTKGIVELALLVAHLFESFGTDRGAMVVTVCGIEADIPVQRLWRLRAEAGEGPFIPAAPARALLRKLGQIAPGARPCIDELTMEELQAAMSDLAVTFENEQRRPLFQEILGASWDRLAPPVRDLHSVCDRCRFAGTAQVDRGTGLGARLVASIIGFPAAGHNVPVQVTIATRPNGETWIRTFGRKSFRSQLSMPAGGKGSGVMTERFGAVSVDIALDARDGELLYPVVGGRAFGIPLPKWLLPSSETREYQEGGKFHFDVALGGPLGMGLIVRYRGFLERDRQTLGCQGQALASTSFNRRHCAGIDER